MDNKIENFVISYNKKIYVKKDKIFVNENEIDIDKLNGNSVEDLAKQETRKFYKKYLSNHFENLVFLTGAGSSIGVGKPGNQGMTRKDLWDSVVKSIGEKELKDFATKIKYEYPKNDEIGDIEEMLSLANRVISFLDDKEIEKIIEKIQKQIVKDCTLTLPENSPHKILLSKVMIRKLKYSRVKIFTLNYDTLFEQAALNGGFTIVDGFSFSLPRTFGGQYFDYDIVIRENSRIQNEENYVSRVFHLYKPHGSLDWEQKKEAVIKNEKTEIPLIIYPKDSKYESSYEQPFFEMMSRFQRTLRQQNTLLICIGFSFYDKHIKAMIKEAVTINPSFRLFVVSPDISSNTHLDDIRILAENENSVVLINEKFSNFADNYPYPQTYKDEYVAKK